MKVPEGRHPRPAAALFGISVARSRAESAVEGNRAQGIHLAASWDREMEIVDQAGGGELVFADTLITYWKKIVIEDPRWQPDPDGQFRAAAIMARRTPRRSSAPMSTSTVRSTLAANTISLGAKSGSTRR